MDEKVDRLRRAVEGVDQRFDPLGPDLAEPAVVEGGVGRDGFSLCAQGGDVCGRIDVIGEGGVDSFHALDRGAERTLVEAGGAQRAGGRPQ